MAFGLLGLHDMKQPEEQQIDFIINQRTKGPNTLKKIKFMKYIKGLKH